MNEGATASADRLFHMAQPPPVPAIPSPDVQHMAPPHFAPTP